MKKISFGEKIGYGVGAVGLDLSYGLFYSYLSFYLTNGLGISPIFMLILAPLARLWDGINDPMMGSLVDRTRTKMGRYRPWILTGAILNGIVLALMFNNRFSANSVGLYIAVAVFYVLWGMTNTLADIPFWSMIPSLATEEKDRNLVSTIARAFSGLGQGIVEILTPIIVLALSGVAAESYKDLPSDALKKGFGGWSMIAAVCLVIFASVSVLCTKERNIAPKSTEKFSFKKALSLITHNDQLLIFMLFAMISNCGFYMTSGIGIYYFAQVQGDLSLKSTFSLMGTVGSVISILVIPVCGKFMSNRSTYKFSLTTAILGYAGMAVIGYTVADVKLLGLFFLITSIGTGSMFVNQTVMLADIVDYGEYKLGERNQSLTFSMKGFLQKMAYTMQSIIMFATFAATKYDFSGDTNATVQVVNPQADSAIKFLMFIVPPIMMAISLVIFSTKFKIYGDFKREILDAVSGKKADDSAE